MSNCLGCGVALVKPSQKIYCSVICLRSQERNQKTRAWLDSGDAVIDSRPHHYIRRYLLDAQDGCCEVCGLAELWNDRPLVLVLDHIDGDAANNHRDNLRMVCPNCDSQLPTFKSRNRGKGRHSRRQRYANGQSF
ncbi:HNH endonuclease signature motif containing protein [Nocardioides caeni]|uniref:HNH endonuclease n=1 Tax=Nocardioides caeni TaxID=574700 RepID=A0A4S8N7W9_9ACTN|nr:HNH endonuclease signature motif containing protein [Nocardioides caeni]THV12105.1 HNH endonuclease [Nocardioides caeni]